MRRIRSKLTGYVACIIQCRLIPACLTLHSESSRLAGMRKIEHTSSSMTIDYIAALMLLSHLFQPSHGRKRRHKVVEATSGGGYRELLLKAARKKKRNLQLMENRSLLKKKSK